ncbi:MAG: ABC transporter permease [Calditrichaceae bacterium]|jgi:peptide/nickel transport system permease protein
MYRYISKRFITSSIILWAVLTATFLLVHLAPGDPSMLYLRPEIDADVINNIRSQMGFNQPVWQQYILWIRNFIHGDFGFSFIRHQSVAGVLSVTIPNTLKLTVTVLIFQYVIGIFLGIICALKRKSRLDTIINGGLLFLYAMPGFWVALLAILFFSMYLGWLPSGHMNSFKEFNSFWAYFYDSIRHLILPVLILSIPFVAYTARFVRDKFADILNDSYIITAKAYGLSHKKIMFKYALKNALLPLVTLAGLYLPFLLGGAVITEFIFSWPGMGRITIDAIYAHDYPLILATNFIAAAAVICGNFISDTLYYVVDPRIRFRKKQG